ncbi:polysaccharide deacetylase family protein [Rhodococcus sp. NPDC056960]|uniref:polysaccharide deacetylase family protein n=1 Tax=Rhodococcus sp. NPDC056960 TaxID=3345982 RepID=UPI003637B750
MTHRETEHHPPSSIGFTARLRSGIVVIGLAVVVAGYLLLPAVWQWRSAAEKADKSIVQIETFASGPSDPALVSELAAAESSPQSPPLILTYHDIAYNSSRYTVTPEAFAAQMQLLHDAGWSTISADQLSGWLEGHALPPRSVMISFDDGARGVWQYADPILARYGQRAIAYIITGNVGTHAPYYMTWPEVQQLQSSGRWDLGSHTHLGHDQIPVDAAGNEGPFLSSRLYRVDLQRYETVDEYRTRVSSDLSASKAEFAAHGLPEPAFFAYPFSSHEETPPEKDSTGSGLLNAAVTAQFQAAMLDTPGGVATTTSAELAVRHLDRMDITTDVTLDQWAARLRDASPLDPSTAQPFSRIGEWASSTGEPLTVVADRQVALNSAEAGYVVSRFARHRTTMWNNYTVSADLGGFGQPGDGTSTGLTALSGDDINQVEVSVSNGSYQIRRGAAGAVVVATGALPNAGSYRAEMAVRPDQVSVRIDGLEVGSLPVQGRGSIPAAGGIAISGVRQRPTSPVPLVGDLSVH